MKLIVITNPDETENEAGLISAIIESKLADIHFRKPSFSEEEAEAYLLQFPLGIRENIVTHTHPQLTEKLQLKGVHFTRNTKHTIAYYDAIDCSKSISTHSYDEITACHTSLNYYFLSPIFQSISKQGYGGNAFDKLELAAFLNNHKEKSIIALGGIDMQHIAACKSLGFAGVAVLGSVWQLYQKTKSINEVLAYLKTLRSVWEQ